MKLRVKCRVKEKILGEAYWRIPLPFTSGPIDKMATVVRRRLVMRKDLRHLRTRGDYERANKSVPETEKPTNRVCKWPICMTRV